MNYLDCAFPTAMSIDKFIMKEYMSFHPHL